MEYEQQIRVTSRMHNAYFELLKMQSGTASKGRCTGGPGSGLWRRGPVQDCVRYTRGDEECVFWCDTLHLHVMWVFLIWSGGGTCHDYTVEE